MAILSSPPFVLSVVLTGIYVSLFHLVWGKTFVQLVAYAVAGLVGFALGQAMAEALGLHLFMIGQVNVVGGSLGCWGCLFIARWLRI